MRKRENLKRLSEEPISVKAPVYAAVQKYHFCCFDGPHDRDFNAVPDYMWNIS